MFYNAYNGQVDIGGSVMDYIRFGKGDRHLVMIPGLGDGLRTVKGTADTMALMYRKFAKKYTVWMFSRKQPLEKDCTTRTMARDLNNAFALLDIQKANIVGVSQGGMIAQWLAADSPEYIDKLVLAVTTAKQNNTIDTVVNSWVEMVKDGQFREFTIDNFENPIVKRILKGTDCFTLS